MEVTGLPSKGAAAPGNQQQSLRNHQRGLIYISHHSPLERRRLTSIHPHQRWLSFFFSFADYGEPDRRDFGTNFPETLGCETHTSLLIAEEWRCFKIILSRFQGKPQMVWKCRFIKSNLASFLSLWGIHKKLCTLPENYFWQMSNGAR